MKQLIVIDIISLIVSFVGESRARGFETESDGDKQGKAVSEKMKRRRVRACDENDRVKEQLRDSVEPRTQPREDEPFHFFFLSRRKNKGGESEKET